MARSDRGPVLAGWLRVVSFFGGKTGWPLKRLVMQVVLGAAFLAAWQYLPTVPWLSEHLTLFNRFYISSPSVVWSEVVAVGTGGANGVRVWPYLWTTVEAAVAGSAIGLILGALFGLIFSNSRKLSQVVRPYIVLANSVPRVALIPIFVLLLGPSTGAEIAAVIAVVFFLGFFNAFEGGCRIPRPILENALLLGAGPLEVMRFIRLPQVVTWTFATIPNAIAFGLVTAVTTELLAGIQGMGALLLTSTSNVEASLTFTVIVYLSVTGLLLYSGAVLLRRSVIRWEV